MSFLRHGESIDPMRFVPLGASALAHSQCSSDAMSSSRLFLGRLLSSRACLRFAGRERFCKTKPRRTIIFQRTATTPLTLCLSPRVQSTLNPLPLPHLCRSLGVRISPTVLVREQILSMFTRCTCHECDDPEDSDLGSGGPLSIAFVVQPIRWERVPLAAAQPLCRAWLTFQSQRGLSHNTPEAYSRGLESFLRFLADQHLPIPVVTRAHVGAYLATMQAGRSAISNATVQQRITVLRLFYSNLVDDGLCSTNPVVHDRGRMLVPRYRRLPWIPNEADWQAILAAMREEPIRNRVMLAFAYDAALRREELCGVRTDDIDPSTRVLRIRAENTKGRRDRIVPYSATSGTLLRHYLLHRRALSRNRGPLFLSESRRNFAAPVSIWSWSETVLQIARRGRFHDSQRIHCGTFV